MTRCEQIRRAYVLGSLSGPERSALARTHLERWALSGAILGALATLLAVLGGAL